VASIEDDPLHLESEEPEKGQQALIRTTKSIVIRSDAGTILDPTVISPRFFNAFNHSLVAPDQSGMSITIGVTSAHPGEGKTIVAANLAVSTAVATERDTVIVDFNPRQPKLHTVFGVDIRPGLADALADPSIHVARTNVKNLYVMTAGNVRKMGIVPEGSGKGGPKSNGSTSQSSLMFISSFRDVLYSLQQEFAFVILDMGAASDPALPAIFAQQVNGLLVVIDSNRTTRENVDYVLNRFGADRVRGFVLNRVPGHV
jgi:Mrp family chromosome partitioning ATPase